MSGLLSLARWLLSLARECSSYLTHVTGAEERFSSVGCVKGSVWNHSAQVSKER